MAKSTILKRLPQREWAKLKELLLTRPTGLESLRKIHAHLQLKPKYGITCSAMARYARRLRDQKIQAEAELAGKVDEVQNHQIDLPERLKQEVNNALLVRPRGLESIEKIFHHFKIKQQRVSRERFYRYVRYLNWKKRLGTVGVLINTLFGGSMDEAAKKCGAAYSHLLSAVLNALEAGQQQIETKELVMLSKILAEQRRASVQEQKLKQQTDDTQSADTARSPETQLPENFDDTVQQIYGIEPKPAL